MNKFSLMLTFSFALLATSNLIAKDKKSEPYMPTKVDAAKAMELYQARDFEHSLALYEKLATTGDKHAQYMLSVMYANGYGTEKDPVESYAWAKLSKETKVPAFEKHFEALSNSYDSSTQDKGNVRYKEIYKDYNDIAVARKFRGYFKDAIPTCTGSRIKGNCGNVKVSCGGLGGIPLTAQQEKSCKEYAKKLDPLYIARLKSNTTKIEKHIINNAETSVVVEQTDDKE